MTAFPGTSDSDLPDVHELLQRLVNFARDHFHHVLVPHASRSDATGSTSFIERLGARLVSDVRTDAGAVVTVGAGAALESAAFLAARVRETRLSRRICTVLLTAVATHLRDVIDATVSDDIRRAWIIIDLALTYARGFIADDVLLQGFKPLDKFEFRDWLQRNGAQDQAVHSAVVQAFYDASFSYADGRVDQPNVAAGVAIRATLRIIFGYVGHIVFKMNAGMGDTIFAPIYEVLKRRGVTFKFFHRVTGLEPGPVPGTSARGHRPCATGSTGRSRRPGVPAAGPGERPAVLALDAPDRPDPERRPPGGRRPRVALERLDGRGHRKRSRLDETSTSWSWESRWAACRSSASRCWPRASPRRRRGARSSTR